MTLPIPVYADPAEVTWRDDDVVVLAVKSQDTEPPPAPWSPPPAPTFRSWRPERRRQRADAGPVVRPRPRAVRDDADRAPRARRRHRPLGGGDRDPRPRPLPRRHRRRRRGAGRGPARLPLRVGRRGRTSCAGSTASSSTTSATPSRPSAAPGSTGADARSGSSCSIAEAEQVFAAAGIDPVTEAEDDARRGDHLRLQPVDGERARRRLDLAEPAARLGRRDRLPQRRDRPARPPATASRPPRTRGSRP